MKEMALEVTQDVEHKFELALSGKKLELAHELILESPSAQKWKQLADLALAEYNFALAEECAVKASDLGLLLLLYTSNGDRRGMDRLLGLAKSAGHYNIAFMCLFLTQRVKDAIDLLIEIGRTPEAAFMARTYLPSAVDEVTAAWKKDLAKVSARAAEAVADPKSYPHVFPQLPVAVEAEKWLMRQELDRANIPATAYPQARDTETTPQGGRKTTPWWHRDLFAAASEGTLGKMTKLSSLATSQPFASSPTGEGAADDIKEDDTPAFPTTAASPVSTGGDAPSYPDLQPAGSAEPSQPESSSPSKSMASPTSPSSTDGGSPAKATDEPEQPKPASSPDLTDDDLADFENDSDLDGVDTDELDEDFDGDLEDL